MNWLLAIAVEAVSCFGLFAIAWQRGERGTQPTESKSENTKPWRLVEGAELVVPGRPLLRLTGPKEGPPAARKPKTKANGKAGRKARPPPNGNSHDAESDQLKREKGASDVR
jgi:hypothetical protein